MEESPLLIDAGIFYKHHLSGQPDDALAVITHQSSLLEDRNMQLLCTRWTWLTGKHEIKGFFIFFNLKTSLF